MNPRAADEQTIQFIIATGVGLWFATANPFVHRVVPPSLGPLSLSLCALAFGIVLRDAHPLRKMKL